jgi:hypothetical protein
MKGMMPVQLPLPGIRWQIGNLSRKSAKRRGGEDEDKGKEEEIKACLGTLKSPLAY